MKAPVITNPIAIEMILTGNEMYVHADMGKIQQVLYNLMDNAIKFSHHDSVIHIETSEKKNKLFVSVKDTGIGIPKEDLKLIWDRFYKSDLSRGKDKKGTGLGLSIVKEIINAHNEHINVISTPRRWEVNLFSPCRNPIRKTKRIKPYDLILFFHLYIYISMTRYK